MNLAASTRSTFLLLAATAAAPAQTFEVLHGVDTVARRFTTEFRVSGGPAGGLALLLVSPTATEGRSTAYGTLNLDPVGLALLAIVPLNGSGVGSATFNLPAGIVRGLSLDAQALLVSSSGAATLTSWVMFGWYANTTLTEMLAAKYEPAIDRFQVMGQGPSGVLMEVFRQNGATGTRDRLGGMSVPFSNFSWNIGPVGLTPPGRIEVVFFGISIILRLE